MFFTLKLKKIVRLYCYSKQKANQQWHLQRSTMRAIQWDAWSCIFLHSKSNLGSVFASAGLIAVSMSLMLAQYFVLIDVKVEKADSHKYVETNRRTLFAKSDNVGYSALELSQKVLSFFLGNSSCNFESEDSSANYTWELRGRCSVLWFDTMNGFWILSRLALSNLEENTFEIFSSNLSSGKLWLA